MLMDALAKLLHEKDFADISIAEIAAEATLNRATFYLHFADKDALLQAMTAKRFGEMIDRRGVRFTDCEGALRAIALGVCDYLVSTTACGAGGIRTLPLEQSIIPVLEEMFRRGRDEAGNADREFSVTAAAWAVYGAARRWYRMPDRIPAEEMAARIEAMVRPILMLGYTAHAPEALPS